MGRNETTSRCGSLFGCTSLHAPGHVDDRKPVPKLVRKLFGDQDYISKAFQQDLPLTFNVQLITGIRSNMKKCAHALDEQTPASKRAIVETIIDQLKNISRIGHSRHRSPTNSLVNFVSRLIAYCHQSKKPSLELGISCFTCLTRTPVTSNKSAFRGVKLH